uniref:Uncharacterized protein n=1 Tax=Myoviridae sp. ctBvM24 TaxID=2825050 RepID=A0A8S5UD68_9CAUD|nr:MAG TPA: hypothetical protein [Myoviridae sp. ctBvM24]
MEISTEKAILKGEVLNAIAAARKRGHGNTVMIDGVLSEILADIRAQETLEMLNERTREILELNQELKKVNQELEKAKEAAKKKLVSDSDTDQEGVVESAGR